MDEIKKLYDKAFELKVALKFDESIAIFKKIIEKDKNESQAVKMIAMLYYYEKSEPNKALPYAKEAVQKLPKSEVSSICLVHCLFELNRNDEANVEIRRFIATGSKLNYYKTLFEENNLNISDFQN